MKYTFRCEHEENGFYIEHKCEEVTLSGVLRHFLYFLRGCSFIIDSNSELEVTNPADRD